MAIIPVYPYGTDSEVTGISTMRAKTIKMERGALKDSSSSAPGAMNYTIASYNGYIRSSMLIRTNDATKVTGKTLTGFTVYEYKVVNNAIVYNKVSNAGDKFHADTRYIKIVKQSSTLPEEVVLMFDGDVEEVYNVQIEKGTSSGHLLSEMLVFDVGDNVCTTARLLLPSTYAIDGKKVPLIIWDACDGSFISWSETIDHVGSSPAYISDQLQYLADSGFAVLNVYSWGSYNNTNYGQCGMSGAIPTPVSLRSHDKAVEYVTSRFNISDTNIFILSWSGSGKLSSYYAIHKPNFNLRSIYAFSPVIDGLCFKTSGGGFADFRKALHSEMHFDDVEDSGESCLDYWLGSGTIDRLSGKCLTFITANLEKFAKSNAINWHNLSSQTIEEKLADTVNFATSFWDESYYNKNWGSMTDEQRDIYNRYDLSISGDGVPITIIGAEDDNQCPYMVMEEFIIQLRNGGNEAKLITLPRNTGGHLAPIYNNKVTVGNKEIPYGWWYAVQDIKARFLKND